MKIKNVVIDTTEMSYEDVDNLIQSLRKVRERKTKLQGRLKNFHAMITHMRNEDGMTFVSKYTGEVLNPDDWELYDEIAHAFYRESNKD